MDYEDLGLDSLTFVCGVYINRNRIGLQTPRLLKNKTVTCSPLAPHKLHLQICSHFPQILIQHVSPRGIAIPIQHRHPFHQIHFRGKYLQTIQQQFLLIHQAGSINQQVLALLQLQIPLIGQLVQQFLIQHPSLLLLRIHFH